jgi:hypothetical protein
MFDLDFDAIEKEITGKEYAAGEAVKFTIKTAIYSDKFKTLNVECVDDEGYVCKFKIAGSNDASKNKLRISHSFMSQFYTREELKARTYNFVVLVGQRFQAKSEGAGEFNGIKFQKWEPSFIKLEPIASAEEFQV